MVGLRALALAAWLCQAWAWAADGEALVQAALQLGRAATKLRVSEHVEQGPDGDPRVTVAAGEILGIFEYGCNTFKNIPYGSVPERFAPSVPAKPWAPEVLDATEYGKACIGAHAGMKEDENCLSLNVWVPAGEHRNMPVLVYFHGGMLQHGSGSERYRLGDGIAASTAYPTILVNFDFRLGIMGAIYGKEEDGIHPNLWLQDQQQALAWIKQNIAAFGGDATRVVLEGQSEGGTAILAHLVSPQSAGLFSRAVLHSPPADMWSRDVNRQRTEFLAMRVGCKKRQSTSKEVIECLKKKDPVELWAGDWLSEELSRLVGHHQWWRALWGLTRWTTTGHSIGQVTYFLGWHAEIDGRTMPGEPRDLIAQGRWNKVPVLVTVSKNETLGVIPQIPLGVTQGALTKGLEALLKKGDLKRLLKEYNKTLAKTNSSTRNLDTLRHLMLTDKMWTCDVRALADDIARGGGEAYIGMWWYSPKFDPVGCTTNKVCAKGATCHAAEMTYVMPQLRGASMIPANMTEEVVFSMHYRDQMLAFVHGSNHPWVPYNSITQPMTFTERSGTRVVAGYRKEQCDLLDTSMNANLPSFHHRRSGAIQEELRNRAAQEQLASHTGQA